VVLLCCYELHAGDNKTDDLSKMQGKWKAVETIDSGKPVGREVETNFTITQKKMQIAEGKEAVLEFTLSLDASKKPKQIDMTLKGFTMLGIYELQGDMLRICIGPSEKERPLEFVSKVGDNRRLVTLKRIKTDK